ncbi:hypothetical protein D9Q98_004816 [Chlorella vulgaris]|uniref:RING-type domain-containing protein n=1 Tax=Chlorella vulgaris TaxID=3077 RepID=A0A9D4TN38_CHLVU|nr:hypothetical protein D9Q98_004816 [Chlorella vulgaris]
MSCPFKHLWPGSGTAQPQDDVAAPQAAAACPFTGRASQQSPGGAAIAAGGSAGSGGGGARPAYAATAAPAASSEQQQGAGIEPATPTSAGQCPFLAGVSGVSLQQTAPAESAAVAGDGSEVAAQQSDRPADGQQGEAAPAVCPLGFGRGAGGPRLGQFHCFLCKSLFYRCTVTSCGHRFCAGCIAGAADCPACGADITSLQPDPQTQELVERYIEAHAGSHTIWELEAPAGGAQQVEGMAGQRGRASFLLQLGLRAIAAGNTDSARHRFLACQQDLQAQLAAAEETAVGRGAAHAGSVPAEAAALHCRLGAVSGCLGDCCRAEGDADGMLRHYQRSVELLQAAGPDPEAQQALSVALNKVGELRHMQGQLPEAAALYEQALQLRRGLLAATQEEQQAQAGSAAATVDVASGEATCSATLDLAASCIKLAGARRELAANAEAQELLAEAAQLLAGLEAGLQGQPVRLQRKHASLAGFVAMLGAQMHS